FAVFVPDLDDAEADALAVDLLRRAEATPFAHREQWPLRLRLGYSRGTLSGSAADLLEEAGAALAQVVPGPGPALCRYRPGDGIPLASRAAMDWPGIIERLLEQRALALLCQPAVSVPERAVIGCELYTRALPE